LKCRNRKAYDGDVNHYYFDLSTVNRLNYSEDETFIDSKYNPSYDDPDTQDMETPEQHLLIYSEYVKDSSDDQSIDKEFEDFLYSNGVKPDKYILPSGKLILNQGMHYSDPVTLLICDKDRIMLELVGYIPLINNFGL
jgi:hypothetical protein